jgi:hypothetical protein
MTEAEKNETMLDKATLLETKLDDAFFGGNAILQDLAVDN